MKIKRVTLQKKIRKALKEPMGAQCTALDSCSDDSYDCLSCAVKRVMEIIDRDILEPEKPGAIGTNIDNFADMDD